LRCVPRQDDLQTPGSAGNLDQLISNGKTLRGLIVPTGGESSAFFAQATISSASLGVAINQACYATDDNHERAVLKNLLGQLVL
jgi:hypothetical protein